MASFGETRRRGDKETRGGRSRGEFHSIGIIDRWAVESLACASGWYVYLDDARRWRRRRSRRLRCFLVVKAGFSGVIVSSVTVALSAGAAPDTGKMPVPRDYWQEVGEQVVLSPR